MKIVFKDKTEAEIPAHEFSLVQAMFSNLDPEDTDTLYFNDAGIVLKDQSGDVAFVEDF